MSFEPLLEPTTWIFRDPQWLNLLWGLPLVLLLHLLRRPLQKLRVPHLPFWEKVLARARKRRPSLLKLLLIILLEILLLGGVVLLLAEPGVVRPKRAPEHTTVIVDRSLGTRMRGPDGRTLGEQALLAALRLCRRRLQLGTVSLGLLLRGGLLTLVPATLDPAAFERQRLDVPSPAGSRDWPAVGELGRMFAGDPRAQLFVVGPFAPPPKMALEFKQEGVGLVGVGGVRQNGGIRRVERQAGTLLVTVQTKRAGRILELWSKGRRLLGRKLQEPGHKVLALPLGSAGEALSGELKLLPLDAFALDDRVPLSFARPPLVRVLVVARARTPYLDAWLKASPRVDRDHSGRVEPEAFRGLMEDYDTVILVGLHERLPLPRGRYLLLGSTAPGLPLEVDGKHPGPARVTGWQRRDPLARALHPKEWVVARMGRLKALPGLEVVVAGSRGPLVARGRKKGLRFVFLGVAPDAKVSSFPRMAAFPLFLEAALLELAGRPPAAPERVLRAGGVLRLAPGEEPKLLLAGGQPLPLRPLPSGTGFRLPEIVGRFHIAGPSRPRPVALAILDHPGLPGPPLHSQAVKPLAARSQWHSLAPQLSLILFGLLLLDGWLHALLFLE